MYTLQCLYLWDLNRTWLEYGVSNPVEGCKDLKFTSMTAQLYEVYPGSVSLMLFYLYMRLLCIDEPDCGQQAGQL